MANEVRMKIDTAVVGKKDFEVEVKTKEGKLGKLLISKGNVEWLPKSKSKNKKQLSWEKFGELMEEHGKSVKAK